MPKAGEIVPEGRLYFRRGFSDCFFAPLFLGKRCFFVTPVGKTAKEVLRIKSMRKTKIVCTIGPACSDEETLKGMCLAGMNVARLNFSHGTHEEHQKRIDLIKKVRTELQLPIAILLDTKGPEFRIGTFEHGQELLNDGQEFIFTTEEAVGNKEKVSVSYKNLHKEMHPGERILVNNGLLIFEVTEICGKDIHCKVLAGGIISDRKSMSFPGKILPLEITGGKEFILQKQAFLASTKGVDLSVHFSKKFGAGFFGGEGFIMQKLSGSGMAFVEIDGDLVEYNLAPGQQLLVDTGNVAGFETSVSMEIRQVQGLKNKLLGGEGLFNTLLTGPGKVWLQTMPISNVANAMIEFIPTQG